MLTQVVFEVVLFLPLYLILGLFSSTRQENCSEFEAILTLSLSKSFQPNVRISIEFTLNAS